MPKTKVLHYPYPEELKELPGFSDTSWKNDRTDSVRFCGPGIPMKTTEDLFGWPHAAPQVQRLDNASPAA